MVVFGQAAYARRLAEAGVPQPIAERAIVMLNFALRLDSSTLQDWSRALLEQVLVVYARIRTPWPFRRCWVCSRCCASPAP